MVPSRVAEGEQKEAMFAVDSACLAVKDKILSESPGCDAAKSPSPPRRCRSLEYANLRKEEARESFKEDRRRDLLAKGELERIKRRKKNDTSMSDDEKYHRRLKMNQDSAAAARYAQDVYMKTLEELVSSGEKRIDSLTTLVATLRSERNEYERRTQELQKQVAGVKELRGGEYFVVPEFRGAVQAGLEAVATAEQENVEDDGVVQDTEKAVSDDTDSYLFVQPGSTEEAIDSALLMRKMVDVFGTSDVPVASARYADLMQGITGFMPAPAV